MGDFVGQLLGSQSQLSFSSTKNDLIFVSLTARLVFHPFFCDRSTSGWSARLQHELPGWSRSVTGAPRRLKLSSLLINRVLLPRTLHTLVTEAVEGGCQLGCCLLNWVYFLPGLALHSSPAPHSQPQQVSRADH